MLNEWGNQATQWLEQRKSSLFSWKQNMQKASLPFKVFGHWGSKEKKVREREKMNGLPICGFNIIWKKSDLPFLSLAATQVWEVSLEEQKRASSFKCHLVSGSSLTPPTSHLALNRAGHFHRPLLSFSNTDILLIIQCKSERKLMCQLLAGRTEHLNVMVC